MAIEKKLTKTTFKIGDKLPSAKVNEIQDCIIADEKAIENIETNLDKKVDKKDGYGLVHGEVTDTGIGQGVTLSFEDNTHTNIIPDVEMVNGMIKGLSSFKGFIFPQDIIISDYNIGDIIISSADTTIQGASSIPTGITVTTNTMGLRFINIAFGTAIDDDVVWDNNKIIYPGATFTATLKSDTSKSMTCTVEAVYIQKYKTASYGIIVKEDINSFVGTGSSIEITLSNLKNNYLQVNAGDALILTRLRWAKFYNVDNKIDEISEKVNEDVENLKATSIPQEEISDYPVVLTDALPNEKLLGCKVYGGANLFNMNATTNSKIELHPDENYFDIKDSYATLFMEMNTFFTATGLKVGDTITTSKLAEVVSGSLTDTDTIGRIVFLHKSDKTKNVVLVDYNESIKTITIPEDLVMADYYGLYVYGIQASGGVVRMKEVQIVKGEYTQSTMPTYQPYGGIGDESKTEISLYPYTNTTKAENGITFTDNKDGTITVNGTATANVKFTITSNFNSNVNGKTYFLSGCPSGGAKGMFNIQAKGDSTWFYDIGEGIQISNVTAITEIIIYIVSGATVDNIVFSPKLEEIRYMIPVTISGKNIVPPVDSGIYYNGSIQNGYPYIVDNSKKIYSTNNVNVSVYRGIYAVQKLKEGTTYTLSFKNIVNNCATKKLYFAVGFRSSEATIFGSSEVTNCVYSKSANPDSLTFTVPSGCPYCIIGLYNYLTASGDTISFDGMQVEEGTVATEYEAYAGGSIATINLDSPLMQGEYIDVINKKKYNGDTVTDVIVSGELRTIDSSRNVIECDTTIQPSKMNVICSQNINKVVENIKNQSEIYTTIDEATGELILNINTKG